MFCKTKKKKISGASSGRTQFGEGVSYHLVPSGLEFSLCEYFVRLIVHTHFYVGVSSIFFLNAVFLIFELKIFVKPVQYTPNLGKVGSILGFINTIS